jgi:hypothetical protein
MRARKFMALRLGRRTRLAFATGRTQFGRICGECVPFGLSSPRFFLEKRLIFCSHHSAPVPARPQPPAAANQRSPLRDLSDQSYQDSLI